MKVHLLSLCNLLKIQEEEEKEELIVLPSQLHKKRMREKAMHPRRVKTKGKGNIEQK